MVYIRVQDVSGIFSDRDASGTLSASITCDVSEAAETSVSDVKDLEGGAASLSTVPCHPSHGLMFGGFLSKDDLKAHRGEKPYVVKDIAAAISSDATRARLKKSATVPGELDHPVVDIAVFLGAADSLENPGEHCPWDLKSEAVWPKQEQEAAALAKQDAAAADSNLKTAVAEPASETNDGEQPAADQAPAPHHIVEEVVVKRGEEAPGIFGAWGFLMCCRPPRVEADSEVLVADGKSQVSDGSTEAPSTVPNSDAANAPA